MNGMRNAMAHRVALGEGRALREVYAYPGVNIGRASLILSEGGIPCGASEVIALDEFAAENGLGAVRMLKIDVEGFELQVLRGARSLLRGAAGPILCIEADRAMPREGGGMEEIHAFIMAQRDYVPYAFAETKFRNFGLTPMSDIRAVPDHDNVIYIPSDLLESVPAEVFA